jgi:two-component system chemotaxis response regulator CheY
MTDKDTDKDKKADKDHKPASAGEAVFKERKEPYDLSNFTILVVEDSIYMQSLITSMLKVFGVGDIMIAEGGKEAIDILTVTQARSKSKYITRIDIILTDWLMNKGSGEELLSWVRKHEKDEVRFLPVVVVSGYATEALTARARDCGANETLVKPVSAKGLAQRICTVIDNPRPFINVPGFFGPDRRRQQLSYQGAERRIISADHIVTIKK